MITPECRVRLRPSIAMVSQGGENWQFFQGNTRRSRVYRLCAALSDALKHLDGIRSLQTVAEQTGAQLTQLVALADALHENCLVEDADVAWRIAKSPWRRILNFIGDYIPSSTVEDAFTRLTNARVIVLGTGAVGSWVATQLCQSGIKSFVLIDDDIVESSNLNRSLFSFPDIGRHKADALAGRLKQINPRMKVDCIKQCISDAQDLIQLISARPKHNIVVNCADTPSVDATSSMVDAACKTSNTPYVIAGGYNLHLSLIGMTVMPGQTACYHCGRLTLEEQQGEDLSDMRKLVRPWRNIGNLAPLAAITASFAANEVIRVALADDRLSPAMINRRGEFNFLTSEIHFVSLPPRPECGCVFKR